MGSKSEKNITFVTWNIRGFKSKMYELLPKLNEIKCDVVFLQETHIGPNCCKELENDIGWKVYFTIDSPRSKGVAILIRNHVPFEYVCHDEDSCGRYIVLFCRLHEELYTLVNVYKHPEDKTVLTGLKEYLQETAEGMLLVGGDFNIVLDPIFDRKSSVDFVYHSQFRAVLEDFVTTLNLRDIWSYKHPTTDGFTQLTTTTDATGQKQSQSRIDMIFIQEATMGRLSSCEIEKNQFEGKTLSDHDLLLVQLKVQESFKNIEPLLVSKVQKQQRKPIRKSGKICGAEILKAIKSLSNFKNTRGGVKSIKHLKKHRCTMTEVLKEKYNQMLIDERINQIFRQSEQSGTRHIFGVDYLIFTQILANRLNAFITPSFRRIKKENLKTYLTVIISKDSQNIKWSFLKKCLNNLKKKPSTPLPNFKILGALLPFEHPVSEASGEVRNLRNGCPLTEPILKLALGRLDQILTSEKQAITTVCYHRQALRILSPINTNLLLNEFEDVSGITLERVYE